MEPEPRYVGIDVAKARLDVAVRPTGEGGPALTTEQRCRDWSPSWSSWNRLWCCWKLREDWK